MATGPRATTRTTNGDGMGTFGADELERAFTALRGPLLSYLFRLTTDRDAAEDLAQETYVRARRALDSFEGRSSIETWLFAIATNLARDHHRVRQRWSEDSQDRCRTATRANPRAVDRMRELVRATPAERYEFREHLAYCFTCIAKTLDLRQQLVLVLKDVYGFTVDEIVEILDSSRGRVKHALAEARATMADIFDRRCVLVSKEGVCHQCSEMQGFYNPKQDAREAALRLDMVREAEAGAARERLLRLRAELVRSVDPLAAIGSDLHAYLLSLMAEHP